MVTFVIFIFSACSKPPSSTPADDPLTATITPPSVPMKNAPVEAIAAPPVAAAKSQRSVTTKPADLPENPFELERLYYSGGTTLTTRIQIIRTLGNTATAGSVDLLCRLFKGEKRFETKTTILEVAGDLDKELHRERILTLLTDALGSKQPRTVREIALIALADLEDPRAVALLRSVQFDPDLVLRKVAADLLDDMTN
ncbi:MAG: hypothetical protein JWL59_1517 [Chthoniobacteraceae bacterium]|nr:hypothetical protein [Chthoniobacteraceae bacterium]